MTEVQARRPGRIELIGGCMFSGKSERLLARLAEARARALPVAAFKHASDDRYAAQQIVTHSGRRCPATPVGSAAEILALAAEARLVVIDEAQFFSEELTSVCQQLAAQGRTVVVAGLDLDSWGQPFGPMPALAAVADEVVRTSGVCSCCGGEARYTQRLLPVDGVKMIGGPEAYEPRCAACFRPPPMELRR